MRAEHIEENLKTKWIGKKIFFYDSIDSTNARAKEEAKQGVPGGTLFVAEGQTAGRGRRGRDWESPAGKNIYFTLLLKPDCVPNQAAMLTLVMAMAVAEAIERSVQTGTVRIKWPNDIVINGRKVCGILTEMGLKGTAIDYVAVGVGLNVYRQKFGPELADKAADIETLCGKKISRSALLVDILEIFEEKYAVFQKDLSLARLKCGYDKILVNRGLEVRVLDPKGEYSGIALGITDTGELLVRQSDGSVTEVYAGEVSVRGICGYV